MEIACNKRLASCPIPLLDDAHLLKYLTAPLSYDIVNGHYLKSILCNIWIEEREDDNNQRGTAYDRSYTERSP